MRQAHLPVWGFSYIFTEGEFIPYNVMTMRVTAEDVDEASIEEVRFCPHFLQDGIEKPYELRVVYIDGTALPFKVDSQRYRTSKVDWRKGLDFIEFSPTTIDIAIDRCKQKFMDRLGLFAGSLDLIVREDGEVYFLECNQEGAWGWLDDIDGGRVTVAFADALTRRAEKLAAGTHSIVGDIGTKDAAEQAVA